MVAVGAKPSPSFAAAAGRRLHRSGGGRGAAPSSGSRPQRGMGDGGRALLRCQAAAVPGSPEVAPTPPSAPEPTTAQAFVKCVPPGDERERDMCGRSLHSSKF
jgi:hypothetical protein